MNRRHACAAVALAVAAVTAVSVAPAGAHADKKKSSRPAVGAWTTVGSVTYYAQGSYKVTDHGKKLSQIKFTPNDGVMYCGPGKYTVSGSFAIHKGGPKGYQFHVGKKVKGQDVYQVNSVAYKINGKKQPAPTSLEIDLRSKHAHVEFGPYGTTSCNLFWDMMPK